MIENFTAKIGARITEFNKKMREVNNTVRKTAMAAEKPIGADISEFKRKMNEVIAKSKTALRPGKMNVGAKIAEFRRNMEQARALAASVLKRGVKTFGADISEFNRKMALVSNKIRSLNDDVVITVRARIKDFRNKMDRIANSIRTVGEIAGSTFGGALFAMSPGAVPIIAALVGLLGALGPMVGTVAGSAFALGTAFVFAGLAGVAFGAVAIPTIKKLFDETGKLTAQQKASRAEYDKFQKTWQGIVKDLEKPVLQAFGKAMQFANSVLKMARPLFDSAATAVNNLLTSLNQSLNTEPVKAFFDYMNKSAGPMLEVVGKGIGFMMQGIMSMMTAFGPLAEKTALGFLSMNEGFATWAAGLSKSEKFQAFVNYVNENMPKIRTIFADALAGIAYFFAAFGPLSSDMMTSLADMMARFKEWSKTLSDNEAFQDFIGYIRENAPKVIELIGNLATFIVNLGVALAPMGSKVLNFVNAVLKWTNSMMDNHPWIGKIIGLVVVFAGLLVALAPHIIAVSSLFGGLSGTFKILTPIFTGVVRIFTNFLPILLNIVTKLPWLGAAFSALTGPVGLVITIIGTLAYLIYRNWADIKKWTTDTFNSFIKVFETQVPKAVAKAVGFIRELPGKVLEFRSKMLSAGGDLIQGLIDGVIGMASSAIASIKRVAGDMVDAALSFFNINSPSRVFRDIGAYLPAGLAAGVKKNASAAVKSITSMASQMTRAFSPQLSIAGVGATMSPIDAGLQMDELKRQIKQELNVDLYVHGDEANRSTKGGGSYGNVYVTIDAKNVKEFNDVIKMLDEQEWDSN